MTLCTAVTLQLGFIWPHQSGMAQQYICDNTKINFYMILISCYTNTMCLCSLMHTTMRRAQTRLTVRGTSGSDVLLAADQVAFTGYLTDPLISLMHPSGRW